MAGNDPPPYQAIVSNKATRDLTGPATNHLLMMNMLLGLTSEHVKKPLGGTEECWWSGQALYKVVKRERDRADNRGSIEVPKDGDKGCVWFLWHKCTSVWWR